MSTAKITSQFHYNIAKSLYDDIATNTGLYSYFLAKNLPWSDLDNIPEYGLTLKEEYDLRDNIVSTKKVNIGDVAFTIPNNQWSDYTDQNRHFDMYDDTVDMTGKKFYCITPENRIYKCINNNNGALATTKPVETHTDYFDTPEGYVWKYMADIPLGFINKFSGSGMIPITRKIHNEYYSGGTILNENISIRSPGSGYVPHPTDTLTITGDGANAEAEFTVDGNGAVTGITLTNGGYGYTDAVLTIVSNTGTGFLCDIHITDYGSLDTNQGQVELDAVPGSLSTIVIENGGSDYINPGNVSIVATGDGSGFAASLTIVAGVIVDVIISNYGTDYTYISLEVQDSSIDIEKGSGAILRPILSPRGGHGSDLPRELEASTLCMFNSLDDDHIDYIDPQSTVGNTINHSITVRNSYGQVGVIKGINQSPTTAEPNPSKFFDVRGTTCYLIQASGVAAATVLNSTLYASNGDRFIVTSYDDSDPASYKVLLLPVSHNSVPANALFLDDPNGENPTGLVGLTVTSILGIPTIDPNSGDIILAENRIPFSITGSGAGNQGAKFKTFISF